ncbi:hypothetical protein TRVL_08883 [Trypanosoma vivax]|nr:hypothetical protein TRVL_08883 [Trypanosoma vivax]
MQAHFAAEDGENNGPKQRICQPEGQIQHTLECAKSVRDANGMLAAEDGLLKVGRVHSPTETRGARAQRSGPNTQLAQLWAVTVLMHPQPANSSSRSCMTRC